MKKTTLRYLAYASCAYALLHGSLFAQTVIPPGLGAMSSTQPSRGTAILSGKLTSTGGQNPTVKIRWGDEDRGTAITPSTAWDNEVTISTNQATGTFSTTITIPNLEKFYYFRAVADNAGGAVVSRSLGVLLPDAPVGVENLQGRWDFNGQNADDSSGMTRHGTAKKLFSPSEISGMNLWLDATDSSTITASSNSVSQWRDKSGSNHHFEQSTAGNQPTTGSASINGKNAMSFDGSDRMTNDNISFTGTHSIYVVASSSSSGGSYTRILENNPRLFFGKGNGNNDFAAFYGNGGSWHDVDTNSPAKSLANACILAVDNNNSVATPYVNGTAQNTKNGTMPTLTGLTLGAQSNGNQAWSGPIGEILVFTAKLSDSERQQVEGYLAHKWALQGKLPSSHPYYLGAPVSASGTPEYISDTPFGSGKAIDLANGHVEVTTGESEDSFDGGGASSVSAWVKGWPSSSFAPFVSKGAKFNKPTEIASLKLWLDAADLTTMDQGTALGTSGPPQSDGNSVKFWADKSGNGHHATTSNSPTYRTNSINGKPSIDTQGDWFTITDGSGMVGTTGTPASKNKEAMVIWVGNFPE
jgi:hypothetical protein